MKTNRNQNKLLTALAFSLGVIASPAQSALNLSENPLFLTTSADPNIMFTLDDSGSMQWELMPDEYIYSYYLYPRATSVYGGSDYYYYTVSFDDGYSYTALTRSPDLNAIYYNPEVTYKPWAKPDGSLYSNASTTCAPHNPENTGAGCRDLTSSNSGYAAWDKCDAKYSCSTSETTETFWPAVYYTYNGGDIWDTNSYTKVEIRSGSNYTGSAERTDCASAPTCTYDEEIQNFANWYTYYRSRILAARAGVGRAFSQQSENLRVGFAAINQGSTTIDGASSPGTIVKGVRPFTGSDRTDFFDKLYGYTVSTGGTPLRQALDDVGQYFSRSDNPGPWGEDPGTNDSTPQLTCRQSYNILMTDGYWNGNTARTSGAQANVDNTDGSTITGPNASYQYKAQAPYSDSYSNTLADVAMYYWNRDLRTGLANKVPTNSADPAFWQHLVNFTVGLGVNGTLDPNNDLSGLTAGTTNWPDPTSSGQARIDDLWHAALNSRGNFFSAADPDAFSNALAASLNAIAARTSSASAITSNSTRLDTDTKIYQARFDSSDWTGELYAFDVNADGSVGGQAWKATDNIPAAGSRDIFTMNTNNSNGVTFEWNSLSNTQKTQLDTNILGNNDGLGQDRLNYLRGDQSKELKNGGNFRNRSKLLGDVINSDPLFVGTPDYGYSGLAGNSGNEGLDYVTFRDTTAYENRQGMIFFGANDGMLHALNADSGIEKFTYVPSFVFPGLSELTSPDYAHRYFVDGSPRSGDAYLNNIWRTVLVGSAGAGGRGIFALDITYPGTFNANDVMWEFTDADLGYTIGQPTIVRLNSGDWAALFGNGYNSDNQKAMLFVVDLATGSVITTIDTGVGTSTSPNGLATPVPVDSDGDRITDYVYAGDLQGNLWKFDLTGNQSSQWDSAFKQGQTPEPMFTAKDANGNAQPITIRPVVGANPEGGRMIYFGTGKYIEVGDNVVGANPQVQTFYAVWDDDKNQVTRSELIEQTILEEISLSSSGFNSDVRAISNNSVTYSGANPEKGWYMDLESPTNGPEGERVISRALLRHGRIIFPTVIPSADACDYGGTSWLMEMEALSGARLAYSVFDLNGDGKIDNSDYVTLSDGTKVPVSGRRSNEGMIDTPAIISAGETEYKYTSGSSGNFEVITEKGAITRGRQSWRQLK